jgi:plasmid stabilization system protein ParE
MELILRPAAAADVEEAFSWYEQQRLGLGREFLDAVDAGLREIAAYPLRQAVIFRDTRRFLVKRFPYAVFYRVYPTAIVVVACMRGRRDPLRWKRRT